MKKQQKRKPRKIPLMMRENTHLYNWHEWHYASMAPINAMASACRKLGNNPLNPMSYTNYGRNFAAACELVERVTQRYDKPKFGITKTKINGKTVTINDVVVEEKPFCHLRHFQKDTKVKQPKLLVVAPMSGHHATLLRGTVEALLPHLDVYITDWVDARYVPHYHGTWGFEDYVTYVMEFAKTLGPNVHTLAVCQPAVPVMVAASVMNQNKDPMAPASMTLIGGPIDTRVNPTKVNEVAEQRSLQWFKSNVITRVPFNYPGFMRPVYPGFIQLTGFMTMNMERHMGEHVKLFQHLVEGDGDSAASHRKFYDEYLSVADLPAEFYLETIERVFQKHDLPLGNMLYKGKKVKPEAITKTALLTLEGERDDISGVGQTKAAHTLCSGLPDTMKDHYMQKDVGHYGIFNGRRFREHVVPRIVKFIETHDS